MKFPQGAKLDAVPQCLAEVVHVQAGGHIGVDLAAVYVLFLTISCPSSVHWFGTRT